MARAGERCEAIRAESCCQKGYSQISVRSEKRAPEGNRRETLGQSEFSPN